MTQNELNEIWNYYLSLENDLANTSRYIEPKGQENVHSFEFAKLLILACTEIESVFKAICFELTGNQVAADIAVYKTTILNYYPKITESSVIVARLGSNIEPFSEWRNAALPWWRAYQCVKHNRGSAFGKATYMNAVMAISALYISILYLAKAASLDFSHYIGAYIDSNYVYGHLLISPTQVLPDFEKA